MKIWSKLFLVLATGMMMFSSCLENIEPEGIKDLRGAKAELLRAKTALEEANAAKVNAEAAFVQAQAKIQEAIAKQEEAKAAYEAAVARLKELEVEKQTALDQIEIEKAIAEAQAAIAEAEAQAAVYAAELERDLLNVQAEIAASQAALEVALKDLAIAKNTLTADQLEAIAGLEFAVTNARNDVEAKTVALENAAKQLAAALAEVDEVKANKLIMRMAERKLVVAQAALEGAQKAEAEAEAALELDPSVADWEAKAEAYKAEIEKLDSDWYEKDGEIDDAMSAKRDSVTRVINPMAATYTSYTGYPFNATTGVFSKYIDNTVTKVPFALPELYVPEILFTDFAVPASYKYGEEEDLFEKFDNEISSVNAVETYFVPLLERMMATFSEQVTALAEKETYVEAVEYYEDLVAAYKTGDYVAFANKNIFTDEKVEYEVGPIEDAVKDYNDALASFEEAFDTYVDLMATVKPDQLALEKIEADYFAAIDAAETARYKARNEAQNKKNTAEATYVTAKYANIVKIQTRDLTIENALYVAGFDVVEEEYTPGDPSCDWATAVSDAKTAMAAVTKPTAPTAPTAPTDKTDPNYDTLLADYNAALELYNTVTKPQYDADLALYNKYQKALEAIAKAESDYDNPDPKVETDPAGVWAKAEKDWGTAQDTYDTAIADAEKAYAQAVRAAEIAKDNAVAAYKESMPEVDGEYKAYLKEILNDELPALKTAITALEKVVDKISFGGTYDSVTFMYNTGDMGILFTAAPEYLVSEDKKFVAADVEDIVALIDPDTVLAGIVDYYDKYIFTSDVSVTEVNVAMMICEDYPLSYPTYEEYVAFLDATGESIELSGYVGAYYDAMLGFEAYEALISQFVDTEANKAYVAALEDAKEQIEAIVAENAAQLDADKAEVEAFYAEYLALEEEYQTELDAIKAANDVVKARYNAMVQVIADYCYAKSVGTTNVDALVTALQANYEAAVKDVIFAEETVYQAEQAIADIEAGIVTAADAAQRAYDRAAEELAVAISKLEKATAALENIIAAIYETGEVPETPETPDTPEGGDDTTEGGDDTTEGGEETPAE